jgi:hypothetical protein
MRSFNALKAAGKAKGWPVRFQDDLGVHDKAHCAELGADAPFLWALRESGTHLVPLNLHACRSGVSWGPRPHRAYVDGVAVNFGQDVMWHYWDARGLRAVTIQEARTIAAEADVVAKPHVPAPAQMECQHLVW